MSTLTVAVADDGLVITEDDVAVVARPLDERTFGVELADPDVPTLTFADIGTGHGPGPCTRRLGSGPAGRPLTGRRRRPRWR